ncbi:hypothetical protein NSQ43_10870 [Sporosarcina sp. FSL W8-0480]|uniref:hypothetical protein n=1 Tax=Sporosarcina sp. FSL W8-0480 TaxID=2954701 RepID=UPI0030D6FCF0
MQETMIGRPLSIEAPSFLSMAKFGWHHDRIRPYIGENAVFFYFNISVEKDMNQFGSFAREQDHG